MHPARLSDHASSPRLLKDHALVPFILFMTTASCDPRPFVCARRISKHRVARLPPEHRRIAGRWPSRSGQVAKQRKPWPAKLRHARPGRAVPAAARKYQHRKALERQLIALRRNPNARAPHGGERKRAYKLAISRQVCLTHNSPKVFNV